MQAPQEQTFDSLEALVHYAQRVSQENGYAITTARSQKDKKIELVCDRHGHYTGKKEKLDQFSASSRKIGCPFRIMGRYSLKTQNWNLQVLCSSHNHGPSMHPSGHAVLQRLNKESKETVKSMTSAGSTPLSIFNTLKQKNSEDLSSLQTIYNAHSAFRKEKLAGRTPLEALLDELIAKKVFHSTLIQEGVLKSLFFSFPGCLELAKNYHHIFFMDCTYKTNKYKLPLLHILGLNAFNKSFSVAFCFLPQEKKENYSWALDQLSQALENNIPSVIITDRELGLISAIEDCFPSVHTLLCTWHINKNILVHCKKHFPEEEKWEKFMKAWNCLVKSSTMEDYYDLFHELKNLSPPEVLSYVSSSWLPFKTHFISVWTNKYSHFGNSTTSRIEGGHSYLKRFIQSSTGNLTTVLEQITLAHENEMAIYRRLASEQRMKTISGLPKIFSEVSNIISHHALRQTALELQKGPENPTCTRTYTQIMGMPCAHQMQQYLSKNWKLSLSDFHPQWHLTSSLIDSQVFSST